MIRYEVRFQTPYNSQEWRSQWFNTMKEAGGDSLESVTRGIAFPLKT